PVGPGLLGRIVDPLGRPLDRDEPVKAEAEMPVERPAPAIIERDLVSEPMDTGILVVDALFAVGRGQRELIIGDRATGKPAVGRGAKPDPRLLRHPGWRRGPRPLSASPSEQGENTIRHRKAVV